jgi:5-methylcytosine-specific restriction endonuclease McrA
MGIPVPKPTYKRRIPTWGQRSNFSKDVREQIFHRDDHCCMICGAWSNIIHHVKFRSQGGRGVVTNGATICQTCHTSVHQHHKIAVKLQRKFEMRYGPGYYRDDWDRDLYE